jgi:hypothetical protein
VKEAEREAEDSGEVDSAEVADSAGKVSVAVDSAAKDSAEAEDSAVRVVNRALISDDLLEDFWDDWICFVD